MPERHITNLVPNLPFPKANSWNRSSKTIIKTLTAKQSVKVTINKTPQGVLRNDLVFKEQATIKTEILLWCCSEFALP